MTSAADFDKKYDIVDEPTPRHALMSGRYKQSFAYYTMRYRLPVTLTSIIDSLTKDKDELAAKYGEDSREEIKNVVGLLSKLKYELQTDKPFQLFTGNEPDQEEWNNFISDLPEKYSSFFRSCWLYAECYMYRRVSSFFENTTTLREFDYFAKQKQAAMTTGVNAMELVATRTRRLDKSANNFMRLVKINLWGNRCDLSISSGKQVQPSGSDFDVITSLDRSLLIDDTPNIWNCLQKADKQKSIIVSFICDNAGYELFTDLVLAEYLIDKQLAHKVIFHVKAIPWFVSDVTPEDFHWSLKFWREHSIAVLRDVGKKWTQLLKEDKFVLAPTNHYWTSPYEYYRMKDFSPTLYERISESYLLIFKGDLNYRKLLGDYTWDSTEEFLTCLRGFQPTNLCTLRTLKADLICGLRHGLADELAADNPDWMITGEYGVIQFAENDHCGCLAEDTQAAKPE